MRPWKTNGQYQINHVSGIVVNDKSVRSICRVNLDNHKLAAKNILWASNQKKPGVRWSVFKHVHRGRFSLAWFPEQTRLVLTQWQIVQAKDGRVWLLATNILQSQAFGTEFLNKLNLIPNTWVAKQRWQLKTFRHTLSVHKGDSSENYLNIDPSRFWRPFVDTVWHIPNF